MSDSQTDLLGVIFDAAASAKHDHFILFLCLLDLLPLMPLLPLLLLLLTHTSRVLPRFLFFSHDLLGAEQGLGHLFARILAHCSTLFDSN